MVTDQLPAPTQPGRCMQRHRHQELIRFLNVVERAIPPGKVIHAVLDNYAAHKQPKVVEWLKRHPRWVFHFTPTSGSWLNAVESFFSALTRRRIRRGPSRFVGRAGNPQACQGRRCPISILRPTSYNAISESFFKTLKTKWLYHVDLTDLDHAERELFEYIELFYNNQRRHAYLGYVAPALFERISLQKAA